MTPAVNKDCIIDKARDVLALDRAGLPVCRDSFRIFTTLRFLEGLADEDVVYELVTTGFLVHATKRYHSHVASHLRPVSGGRFEMGTEVAQARHLCGEPPRHIVDLSPFMLAEFTVTNEMFALFDADRL